MFLGSSISSWLVTLIFAGIATILALFVKAIVAEDRRRAAAKDKDYYANGDAAAAPEPESESESEHFANTNKDKDKDAWDVYFPSGKFTRSWYLNMDVIEEGVTGLGSRYRILRDNDTGVLYYADRNGMSVIIKDYRRTRYA